MPNQVNPNLEVEAKFELPLADFQHLKKLGVVMSTEEQRNVYYDRAGRLAGRRITCRIRFSTGAPPVLAVKIPQALEGDVRIMQEFEFAFFEHGAPVRDEGPDEIDVDSQLPPNVARTFCAIGVNRLEHVGSMRNVRCRLQVADVGSIDLDELSLPDGRTFFEAEVESASDDVRNRLVRWLLDHAPQAQPSHMSKYERLWEALREQTPP